MIFLHIMVKRIETPSYIPKTSFKEVIIFNVSIFKSLVIYSHFILFNKKMTDDHQVKKHHDNK